MVAFEIEIAFGHSNNLQAELEGSYSRAAFQPRKRAKLPITRNPS